MASPKRKFLVAAAVAVGGLVVVVLPTLSFDSVPLDDAQLGEVAKSVHEKFGYDCVAEFRPLPMKGGGARPVLMVQLMTDDPGAGEAAVVDDVGQYVSTLVPAPQKGSYAGICISARKPGETQAKIKCSIP